MVEQVVANIDIAPTVFEAMGLQKPPHMDGQSFLPLAWARTFLGGTTSCMSITGKRTSRRRRRNSPCAETSTSTSTYYGLWDTDELYDLQADPGETRNLLHDPA